MIGGRQRGGQRRIARRPRGDVAIEAELEQAYRVALVEARLAAVQGLTGGPLRRWGRLHTYCADGADDDGADALAADAPPRYAWSLARLLDAGTAG